MGDLASQGLLPHLAIGAGGAPSENIMRVGRAGPAGQREEHEAGRDHRALRRDRRRRGEELRRMIPGQRDFAPERFA